MTDGTSPPPELEGRLGWPLPKRRDHFGKQDSQGGERHRVDLMGKMIALPIIRVGIDLPRYRLENGRTASAQQEYLATNEHEPADLFTRDPESDHAQYIQHQLLSKLVNDSDLLGYFRNLSNKQTQPLILDENGFVINGNRRLCAWRTLLWKESSTYQQYAYLDAVVLPPCDEKAIDRLEASLQVEPDIKADYTWDSLANMMRERKQTHGLSTKELAEFYKRSEKEVTELLDMRDYAATYLEKRDKRHQWSLVSDREYAFRELIKNRERIDGAGTKQLFEDMAFALIDDPEGGRLYQAIPDTRKYIATIKTQLIRTFKLSKAPIQQNDGVLGPAAETGSDFALAEEISKPDNVAAAREIIRECIENQKSLEKDKKSAKFLTDRLARVNGLLAEAVASGLRPESSTEGVAAQLQEIEESIRKIRLWLDNA